MTKDGKKTKKWKMYYKTEKWYFDNDLPSEEENIEGNNATSSCTDPEFED